MTNVFAHTIQYFERDGVDRYPRGSQVPLCTPPEEYQWLQLRNERLICKERTLEDGML